MSTHGVLGPHELLEPSGGGVSVSPSSPSRVHALLTRTVPCSRSMSLHHSAVTSPNCRPVQTVRVSRSWASAATWAAAMRDSSSVRKRRSAWDGRIRKRLGAVRAQVHLGLAFILDVDEDTEEQAVVVRLRLDGAVPVDQLHLDVLLDDRVDAAVEDARAADLRARQDLHLRQVALALPRRQVDDLADVLLGHLGEERPRHVMVSGRADEPLTLDPALRPAVAGRFSLLLEALGARGSVRQCWR